MVLKVMPLQATRAGENTKQHCLEFQQGTRTTLGIVGLKRGNTIEDEEGFIQDFHCLRGLHKCRKLTLIGFARAFVRHDCEMPKRLVRLIGKEGSKAARNLRCERVCSTGVLFKEAKHANHFLKTRPNAVDLHRELADELELAEAAAIEELEAADEDGDDMSFGTNDELSAERAARAAATGGDTAETEDSVGNLEADNIEDDSDTEEGGVLPCDEVEDNVNAAEDSDTSV